MDTNTSQDWHWMDVRAALAKKGYTLTRISKEKGYSYACVCCRVKIQRWPDLEKTIADIIGVHPQVIWPSRYKADGSPMGTGIRKKRLAWSMMKQGHNTNQQGRITKWH